MLSKNQARPKLTAASLRAISKSFEAFNKAVVALCFAPKTRLVAAHHSIIFNMLSYLSFLDYFHSF
jgi:hypothetical protein